MTTVRPSPPSAADATARGSVTFPPSYSGMLGAAKESLTLMTVQRDIVDVCKSACLLQLVVAMMGWGAAGHAVLSLCRSMYLDSTTDAAEHRTCEQTVSRRREYHFNTSIERR